MHFSFLRTTLPATLLAALLTLAPVQSACAAEPKPNFAQLSEQSRQVGEPYFKAYISRDWDALGVLLAEQSSFEDPTATELFGGVRQQGRTQMLTAFRDGYASIQDMRFHPKTEFFSGHYAVFIGELDWSLKLPDGQLVRSRMPLVTTLRIERGKVVQHQDLADYHDFVAALKALRSRAEKP